jgi:hypothetical protein
VRRSHVTAIGRVHRGPGGLLRAIEAGLQAVDENASLEQIRLDVVAELRQIMGASGTMVGRRLISSEQMTRLTGHMKAWWNDVSGYHAIPDTSDYLDAVLVDESAIIWTDIMLLRELLPMALQHVSFTYWAQPDCGRILADNSNIANELVWLRDASSGAAGGGLTAVHILNEATGEGTSKWTAVTVQPGEDLSVLHMAWTAKGVGTPRPAVPGVPTRRNLGFVLSTSAAGVVQQQPGANTRSCSKRKRNSTTYSSV